MELPMMAFVIAFMIVVTGLMLVLVIMALRNLPKNLRADMDSLPNPEKLAHLARGEDLPPDLVYDVRVLMESGRKIDAIKRVREVAHWGLKEAKAYVEALEMGGGPAPYSGSMAREPMPHIPTGPAEIPAEVLRQVQDLAARRQKIAAIKLVREVTHWGLKEAKDFVDGLETAY